MPGFRIPKRTALIVFEEGHDYHGAEVRCSLDVPMRTLFAFRSMRGESAETISAEAIAESYKMFAEQILVDWNVEDDDGNPVPCTIDAFLDMPMPFLTAVTAKWSEAVTGVPKASGEPSPNGSMSEAELAQMGAASTSL